MEVKLKGKDYQLDPTREDFENQLMQCILKNRDINEEFEDFFNLSWDDINSPYNLDYIEEAAGRIYCAAENKESIAILIDPDVDGFTSAAILTNYLRRMDPDINITHMFHEDKTHGLSDKKIMKELRDLVKPALLIVPDASGTKEQYEALVALGIDIVTLDHHHEMAPSPCPQVIVVNPQDSPNYTNKALSGAGVVWQLCRVLDTMLEHNWANDWLDLVSFGLIADVMSLKSRETRLLAKLGMQSDFVINPFMRTFSVADSFRFNGFDFTWIGWNIAPAVNGTIRIGSLDEQKMIFQAMLDDANTVQVPSNKRGANGKPVPLAEEAVRLAMNAKGRQDSRKTKLMTMIDNYILENDLQDDKVIIVIIDEFTAQERNLSGVIANGLKSQYERPVMLMYREDGVLRGSMRSTENVPCYDNFKTQCNESGLFIYVSGHEAAAGASFYEDNLEKIREYFNKKYADQEATTAYKADFIFEGNDPCLADTIITLDKYREWWGQGFDTPLIAVKLKVPSTAIQLLSKDKSPTLKIKLDNGVECLKFRSSKAEYDSIVKIDIGLEEVVLHKILLVGRCSVNTWGGKTTPQITIEDYEYQGSEYDF